MIYRVPLVFEPQPEGGFTVTSPDIPELITEGDTLDEAYANVQDCLACVLEIYQDGGRTFPSKFAVNGNGSIELCATVQLP